MPEGLAGFVDDRHLSRAGGAEGSHHSERHELNENWEWSPAFERFVRERLARYSPTLKVCTGLTPVGDDNLDIDPTLDGVTIQGDMLALPIQSFSYEAAATDPPWLDMPIEDRESLFRELVRVVALEGRILQNAPWYPTDPTGARLIDVRYRQEDDVWGCPSFVAIYERHGRNYGELAEYYGYDPLDNHLPDDPARREQHLGAPEVAARMDPEENMNPKAVDPTYAPYTCPLCGCSSFTGGTGADADCYVCADCEYPATEAELDALEDALIQAIPDEKRGGRITAGDVDYVEHTPEAAERELSAYERGRRESLPVTEDLPWIEGSRVREARARRRDDEWQSSKAGGGFDSTQERPGEKATGNRP